MKQVFFAFMLTFLSVQAYGSQIQKLDVKVTGGNSSYQAHTDAIIVGDYNRYVNRMLDVNNYSSMGVPNIVNSKRLTPNSSYIHMNVFFTDVMYYTRSSAQRGPTKTTVSWSLVPKSGPYPEKHNYVSMQGNTVVQVISGTGANTKFSVKTITRVVLKPSAPSFGVSGVMSKNARGSVQAFAK